MRCLEKAKGEDDMKKRLMIAFLCSCIFHMTAYAGIWRADERGYWWTNDDGSLFYNEWQWLDGNKDGVYECYYFDESGYCLMNTTTPDGYQVNEDGAWVLDGQVQTQTRDDDSVAHGSLFVTQWAKDMLDTTVSDGSVHQQIIGEKQYYDDSDGDKRYVFTSQLGTQYAYLDSTKQVIGIVVPLEKVVEGIDYTGFDSNQLKAALDAKSITPLKLNYVKNGKGMPTIAPGGNTDPVCRFVLKDGYTLEIAAYTNYRPGSRCLIYKTGGALKTDSWYIVQ